jgi:hypothetical protein
MKSTVQTTLEKINQTRFVNSMKIFTGIVNIGIGHRGTWIISGAIGSFVLLLVGTRFKLT